MLIKYSKILNIVYYNNNNLYTSFYLIPQKPFSLIWSSVKYIKTEYIIVVAIIANNRFNAVFDEVFE